MVKVKKNHKTCEDIEDEQEAFIDFGVVRLSHKQLIRITTFCSKSFKFHVTIKTKPQLYGKKK